MKLSFVIPAYNEEAYIEKCLISIDRELKRIRPQRPSIDQEIEIVVVNNASSDATKRIVTEFAAKTPKEHARPSVVDETAKGLVWARKKGFDSTTGDLVANVDADTMLPTGWLSTVLAEFQRDPQLVAITGPFIYYDLNIFERLLVKTWYFPGWLFNLLSEPLGHATMLQGGNFVLRRKAWDGVGGYDTSITFFGEDADVARRISKEGRVLWTWRLPMYTTGRRMAQEGFVKTGWQYFINLLAVHITGQPYTHRYTDVRPK